ncbi:MGMT family protein [Nitratidesulfovibrio sp. HK-II]|uniref:methylated-DNA--[protein]-cysteine S-methyltransferase n=1 Tax=Nitratidesulfovibrio sp. HK-II TaxID=2009266 RepID=UPI000E2E797A|nr:MGMT family protein [Nitratidesulfovibrio sp. HK-II]GBO96773.1 methylated-DNA-protein-cysteine methyltransferase [Nitratidesulfovibrio sp. HK-II]
MPQRRPTNPRRPALDFPDTALFDEVRERLAAGPLSLILHWRGNSLREITMSWDGAALASPPAARDGWSNPRPDAWPGLPAGPVTEHGRAVQTALADYVAGKPVRWPDLPLLLDGLTPFTRDVLTALRDKVPHGQFTTYAGLAALAGRPGAARGVGQIMARNPWPLVIPCHRVLGGSGRNIRLHGFGASGLPMKRWLLLLEGAIDETMKD